MSVLVAVRLAAIGDRGGRLTVIARLIDRLSVAPLLLVVLMDALGLGTCDRTGRTRLSAVTTQAAAP
ncbi:MAG: hypothetical protein ACLPTJ_08060, partial [Solirubrobacteraceae bacterium]